MATKENVVEFPGAPELDASQFRVPGTDIRGHTKRIWTNFQPMHVHMMDVLSVPGGKFPYRNRGDFLRHAAVRHFHYLERIDKPLNSMTGAMDAMNTVLREAEFRHEYDNFINKMMKVINDLVDAGDELQAKKVVLEILREVGTMPDGYWKEKYYKSITDKTRRLLDSLELADPEVLFA